MAQLDANIPLSAMGADPRQPQQQMNNALQVFQMKDAMQQRNQAQKTAMDEKKVAKKLQTMTEKGTGLFLRYQGLKDQGFSESAAHAAMQEDWKREIGGLAAQRYEDGSPMFETSELGQLGEEFKAGELGMALTQMMGAQRALDMHFKQQESRRQGETLAETKRHNRAVESKQPASGNRMLPTADATSPTGFVYTPQADAAGKPAPAPRAQTSGKYSSKELQQARDKIRVLGVAKEQLANLKAQRDKIKDSVVSGPGMGTLTPLSESGSNFDAAVDQMRDTITGLTRTPGVGAMSDFETRLSQAKLPTRNEFESSRDQKIQGLESFINNLEGGYRDLLEEGQQPAAAGAVDPQDILDAADAILDSQ